MGNASSSHDEDDESPVIRDISEDDHEGGDDDTEFEDEAKYAQNLPGPVDERGMYSYFQRNVDMIADTWKSRQDSSSDERSFQTGTDTEMSTVASGDTYDHPISLGYVYDDEVSASIELAREIDVEETLLGKGFRRTKRHAIVGGTRMEQDDGTIELLEIDTLTVSDSNTIADNKSYSKKQQVLVAERNLSDKYEVPPGNFNMDTVSVRVDKLCFPENSSAQVFEALATPTSKILIRENDGKTSMIRQTGKMMIQSSEDVLITHHTKVVSSAGSTSEMDSASETAGSVPYTHEIFLDSHKFKVIPVVVATDTRTDSMSFSPQDLEWTTEQDNAALLDGQCSIASLIIAKSKQSKIVSDQQNSPFESPTLACIPRVHKFSLQDAMCGTLTDHMIELHEQVSQCAEVTRLVLKSDVVPIAECTTSKKGGENSANTCMNNDLDQPPLLDYQPIPIVYALESKDSTKSNKEKTSFEGENETMLISGAKASALCERRIEREIASVDFGFVRQYQNLFNSFLEVHPEYHILPKKIDTLRVLKLQRILTLNAKVENELEEYVKSLRARRIAMVRRYEAKLVEANKDKAGHNILYQQELQSSCRSNNALFEELHWKLFRACEAKAKRKANLRCQLAEPSSAKRCPISLLPDNLGTYTEDIRNTILAPLGRYMSPKEQKCLTDLQVDNAFLNLDVAGLSESKADWEKIATEYEWISLLFQKIHGDKQDSLKRMHEKSCREGELAVRLLSHENE